MAAPTTQGEKVIRDFLIGGTITETVDANIVLIATGAKTYAKPTAAWMEPAGVTECAIETANLISRDLVTQQTIRCYAGEALTANEKVGIFNTSGHVGICPHGFPMVGRTRMAQSTVGSQVEVLLSLGETCDRSTESTSVAAATATLTMADHNVLVPYTATGAVTITIPSAVIPYVRGLTIIDTGDNAATNNITIATEGSETIDGAASAAITADSGTLVLTSDGVNLFSV